MVHNICHVEIPTTDTRRAADFYSKLFGWKMDFGMGPDYVLFQPEADPGGGLMKVDKITPGGVIVYVVVTDVDDALAKAQKLGAKIVKAKEEIPNIGWFALFSDLDGNIVGLFKAK